MPPPPAMAAPAVPAAPPPPAFAVAPLPAIPGAPPPAEAHVSGAAPDTSATRVITRRASSQRGWLVAGIVCMVVAVVAGTLMLVLANA
jgi:hypothetical protein